jgi:hypothetical protein
LARPAGAKVFAALGAGSFDHYVLQRYLAEVREAADAVRTATGRVPNTPRESR